MAVKSAARNLVLHFVITVTYGKNHKDTKKGRIKESFYCGLSLCLCVFVVLAYVTVFANNCT